MTLRDAEALPVFPARRHTNYLRLEAANLDIEREFSKIIHSRERCPIVFDFIRF